MQEEAKGMEELAGRWRSVGDVGAGWAFRVLLAVQVSEVTRIHAEVNGSGNTR